mmetsp:Transcript_20342/g.62899  ORF Transcript_20342/g.62899 Transcript_20342/m.62899 type:complete len:212 (+) Transcript_20342:1151-1786(+)
MQACDLDVTAGDAKNDAWILVDVRERNNDDGRRIFDVEFATLIPVSCGTQLTMSDCRDQTGDLVWPKARYSLKNSGPRYCYELPDFQLRPAHVTQDGERICPAYTDIRNDVYNRYERRGYVAIVPDDEYWTVFPQLGETDYRGAAEYRDDCFADLREQRSATHDLQPLLHAAQADIGDVDNFAVDVDDDHSSDDDLLLDDDDDPPKSSIVL